MIKRIAFVMGLLGSAFELFPSLWRAVQFLISAGVYSMYNDGFSRLIYYGGMVLLSAAAVIGCVMIFRKRKLSGIWLCASGFLMLVFSFLTYGILPLLSVLLIVVAGILALVDKEPEADRPADKAL